MTNRPSGTTRHKLTNARPRSVLGGVGCEVGGGARGWEGWVACGAHPPTLHPRTPPSLARMPRLTHPPAAHPLVK